MLDWEKRKISTVCPFSTLNANILSSTTPNTNKKWPQYETQGIRNWQPTGGKKQQGPHPRNKKIK